MTGTVADKRISVVGKGKTWVHWLDVTFATADGATRTLSANVANSIYDRYAAGRPVQITYVRSKPEWFYVPGGEPTQRDAAIFDGMLYYGAVAAALCALGLLAVLYRRHQNRAPNHPSPVPRQFPRASGFSNAGQPRAQCGTRRI